MKRFINVLLSVISLIIGLTAIPLMAQIELADGCTNGTQSSGAIYRICMPQEWNHDLVVFAHGYVSPYEPVGIPEDQLVLPDGTSVPGIVNSLGYAFAVTSYSKNGLAVKEGISDVVDLVTIFKSDHPLTDKVYLVGASEGGLITTLATETHPDVFSGAMAICGPIGNFCKQVNYWGDFKVVFDYFFPGVLPGTPAGVPDDVVSNWETYQKAIVSAILKRPHATEQLLMVTRAPIDPNDSDSVIETVLGILWYNSFATNDAINELNGSPYDNKGRIYTGSDNDFRLNLLVKRFKADKAALVNIAAGYQTSGNLSVPLVTVHNTGDPIVPYWHEPIYRLKVFSSGASLLHNNIPLFRYGHCNAKASEVLAAFAIMVIKAELWDL
ncbi:MAG: hypothetical protein COW41_01215 [Deltaproteobacteria bacterium CG17_big_fil_post_rev_8_21_14_2_50_51_6]|nr:MAG: hypothetical protein AUK25_13815 [Desulfobacteraceae bacterium CG2_30_51_40]PIW01953.1 MAG: hypothetical protein COW41_01215 [Deltaproteobacteria bacterium CG17_big_fil_post_rev_8_21_14_2_50_51_6]